MKQLIALAFILILSLSACSASAELRDGPAPTPAAALAPAQPQVIVIQQPAPVRDDTALVFLMLAIIVLIVGATAFEIGIVVGSARRPTVTYAPPVAMLESAYQPPTIPLPMPAPDSLAQYEYWTDAMISQHGLSPLHIRALLAERKAMRNAGLIASPRK